MSWIEDTIAQLQGGGAGTFSPAASPFPDYKPPPSQADILDAIQRNELENQKAAGGNQPPFGVPDMNSAGVRLAMNNAPAGTGVPGPLGDAPVTDAERQMMAMVGRPPAGMPAGAPDGSVFGGVPDLSKINQTTVPPSLEMAGKISAPPPAAAPPPSPADTLPPPGQVPMPRPRPDAAPGDGPTDVSAQSRQPAPGGPAGVPPAAPEQPSPFSRDRIADALAGFGAALQGDRGALANKISADREAKVLQAQQQNITAQALLRRGADPQEVAAAVKNPELLKAMIGKYFETKPAQNVGGMLVRERPDGKVDILLDNTKEESKKNPVVKDFTNPDGSVISKQWNPATSTWDLIPGFEKPSPKDKDRRLSVSDISKLSEEGGKLSQINTFQSTFKPEFGGWKSNKVGDLVNEAARNLPEGVVGKNAAESAGWWQDYDRYKNMVRHELFGSALTKSESDAFMRADIGPGMTPEQITRNLATQKRVVEAAIRRKGKGLIGSTYDRGAIASAYGVQPEFFDQADDAPTTPSGGMIDIGGQKIKWSVK